MKYVWPLTVPLFFPFGSSSITPIHLPDAKAGWPMYAITPWHSFTGTSTRWPTLNDISVNRDSPQMDTSAVRANLRARVFPFRANEYSQKISTRSFRKIRRNVYIVMSSMSHWQLLPFCLNRLTNIYWVSLSDFWQQEIERKNGSLKH